MRNLGYEWQRYQMMPLTNRNWEYELQVFIGADSEFVLYKNDSIFPDLKKDFKIFSQGFTIGNVPSAYLELTVCKKTKPIPKNAEVRLEIRIVGEEYGNTLWLPWGTYFVDTRDIQQETITLKCYDRMLFGDQDFWNSYASFSGDESAPWVRPALSKEQIMDTILFALFRIAEPDKLHEKLDPRMGLGKIILQGTRIPSEATVRDVLSWVGMANGMNWVISDEDKLRGVVLENYEIDSSMAQNDSLLMMTFSNNPQIFAVTPTQFSIDEFNDSIVEIMGEQEDPLNIDEPTGAVRVISSDTVQYQALVQIYGDSKTTNVEGKEPSPNYWIAGDESKTPVLELSNPLIPSSKAAGEAQVEHAFSRIKDYNYRGIIADTVTVDPAVEFGDSIVLGQYVFEIANISWFGMLAANIDNPLDGNVQSEFPFKAPQAKTFQRVMDAIAGTEVLLELTAESITAQVKRTFSGDIDTYSNADSPYYPISPDGDDKTKLWQNTYFTGTNKRYYFWNDITSDWDYVLTPSLSTFFQQTAEGFNLSGDVKIDGDVVVTENLKLSGNVTWDMSNSPVKTQYSVYSNGPWTSTQNSTHNYMRMSFDGGVTWSTPTQIVGTNGTDADVTPERVFDALTDGGYTDGLFNANGDLYINATYIKSGTIAAARINTTDLYAERIYMKGSPNNYGTIGGTYGDLALYYNNSEFFRLYNDNQVISMKYKSNQFLYSNGNTTYPTNTWNFTSATVSNLFTKATIASASPSMSASQGSHNHGIPDGTWLAVAGGGSVQWTASAPSISVSGGSHKHTIS